MIWAINCRPFSNLQMTRSGRDASNKAKGPNEKQLTYIYHVKTGTGNTGSGSYVHQGLRSYHI